MSANAMPVIKRDFLSAADHRAMLEFALSNQDRCIDSTVGTDNAVTSLRQSLLYEDHGPCFDIVRAAVKPIVEQLALECGVELGPKPRYDGSMNAHPDGAYYRAHVDMGGPSFHRNRRLSAVYYFFRTPAAFTGGELRMFRLDQPGAFVDIPPVDNQLVVFPSMIPHEVREVSVPSGRFEDSRFALNLWVHKTSEEEKA